MEPPQPRVLCGARRNDLDADEWWAILSGEEGISQPQGALALWGCHRDRTPADRRPSKVMSKALRAGFHRLVQRCCPFPVGSRLMMAR